MYRVNTVTSASSKKILLKLLIPLVLILPNILFWTGILTVDGTIIQRDFNFPLFNENFEKSYFPLWNDITSQTNIERFPRLVMMSPFLILSGLGVEISIITKIMIIGAFTVITTTSYLFIKSLVSFLTQASAATDSRRINRSHHMTFISLFASYIFAYNPTNMQFIGGISILLSVGMLPLLLYFILKAGDKKYFPILVVLPLLFSLGHPFVFVVNIMLTVIFFFAIYYKILNMRKIAAKLATSSIILTFLLAWLVLPYASVPTNSVNLGRDHELDRDTFDLVSNNNFYKILLLERDKFIYTSTEPSFGNDITGKIFHYFSLSLIVTTATIAMLFFRRSKNRITKRVLVFLSSALAISILLTLGSSGPLDQPYWFFVSQLPLGWILRSPLKFQLYQGLFASILFAISLVFMSKKASASSAYITKRLLNVFTRQIAKFKMAFIACLLITVFIGSSGFGIYSANIISFNPIKLPQEYFEINELLKTQSDGSKVIYYPRYNEIATTWSEGHIIPPYDMKSSRIPTYDLSTNYQYVKDTLFDYPYRNGLLNTGSFFDFLSTIGIKYIVFHNDRGYDIDQKNLGYLLSSSNLTTLYQKNNWYLFEINEHPDPEVWAIYKIVQTDNLLEDVPKIGSRFLGIVDAASVMPSTDTASSNISSTGNNSNETSAFEKMVALRITDGSLDVKLENEIPNASFSLWAENAAKSSVPANWSSTSHQFSIGQVLDTDKNRYVLKISTENNGDSLWSNLISSEIPVTPGTKYLLTFEAKTQNSHGTHAKLEGYDITTHAWKNLSFISDQSGGSQQGISLTSNSNWTMYRKLLTIPNDAGSISKVRYIINAGGVEYKSLGSSVTLIRQIGMYRLDDNSIIDSAGDNGNASVNFVKIDPTRYQVHIMNPNGAPFLLAFSEAYERGWTASYDNGQEIKSIPLYGMINGFFVDKTGAFTLNIEYRPQRMAELGFLISATAAVSIVGYMVTIQHQKIQRFLCLLSNIIARQSNKNSDKRHGEYSSHSACQISNCKIHAKTVVASSSFSDSCRVEAMKMSETSSVNDDHKDFEIDDPMDTRGGYHYNAATRRTASTKTAIADFGRPTLFDIPILCAIGLTMLIPLMIIALQENIANDIADLAADFLIIGIIAIVVEPLTRRCQKQDGTDKKI
jgi:hypothetical protein